jgi:uncharacterized repeat protein (TIGR02543 family)
MPTTFGASAVGNYIYSVYATYSTGAVTNYTLTTSAANGTVTRTPNQTSYTAGQTVTLQATPNTGYTFSGWSGALTGTTNPATVVMDSNKSVTANFTTASTTKTVGYKRVFSSTSTVANRCAALYRMPDAGRLQSITIYHQGGTGQVLLGVYAYDAGKPGTRLGVTSATTINGAAGWQTVALQSPVSVSAGQWIWLSWVFQNNPGVRMTSGTPGRADSTATWTGGMPTTFGASAVGNYIYSVFATYSLGTVAAAGNALAGSETYASTTETADTAARESQPASDAGAGDSATMAADVDESQTPDSPLATAGRDALGFDRRICMDPMGRNQGRPATVTDAKGNTWVVWHAGEAGERQVWAASFFPVLRSLAKRCG